MSRGGANTGILPSTTDHLLRSEDPEWDRRRNDEVDRMLRSLEDDDWSLIGSYPRGVAQLYDPDTGGSSIHVTDAISGEIHTGTTDARAK
jgi:hypothetical protein